MTVVDTVAERYAALGAFVAGALMVAARGEGDDVGDVFHDVVREFADERGLL